MKKFNFNLLLIFSFLHVSLSSFAVEYNEKFQNALDEHLNRLEYTLDSLENELIQSSYTVSNLKEHFSPFLSQLPSFIQNETLKMIKEKKSLSLIKAFYKERVTTTQKLAYNAHKLADKHFRGVGIFTNEQSSEFNNLKFDALANDVPIPYLEEAWQASRIRKIYKLQDLFKENPGADLKEINELEVAKYFTPNDKLRFIIAIKAPRLASKIIEYTYKHCWQSSYESKVPQYLEPDELPETHWTSRYLILNWKLLNTLLARTNEELFDKDALIIEKRSQCDRARADFEVWYKSLKPKTITPMQKMKNSLLGMGEYLYYISYGNAVTYSSMAKGIFTGKGIKGSYQYGVDRGAEEIGKINRMFNRYGPGSIIGDPATAKNGEFYYNFALAPVISAGNIIQSTLELTEEGYYQALMFINNLDRNELEYAFETDKYFQTGKKFFYVAQTAAAMAIIASTGGATTISGQASLLVRPVITAASLGFVFSFGQELYNAGEEGASFSTMNLLKNTAKGASGSLLFIGGISKLTQIMALRGVSQGSTMIVANGIDIVEGSADIPHTITMFYNSKNKLQYFGAGIIALGNIWDSGDAVFSLGSSTFKNNSKIPKLSTDQNQTDENARIAIAVSLLARPLSPLEMQAIRELKVFSKETKKLLVNAGMTNAEAREIIEAFATLNPKED